MTDADRKVDKIRARLRFPRGNRRYPHIADGGEIAARLDRFLGLLLVRRRLNVVTARLEIRFRKPINPAVFYPVEVEYNRCGNAYLVKAAVIKDGSVAVEASALFLPFGGRNDDRRTPSGG